MFSLLFSQTQYHIRSPTPLGLSTEAASSLPAQQPPSVHFPPPSFFNNASPFHSSQNILRGCSVLLGPATSGLWRALAQSQNHIPGGGPAELTGLLEQYTQILAQNMKLTYLNPVALVAPNIGEFKITSLSHRHSGIVQYLITSRCNKREETNKLLIYTDDLQRFSLQCSKTLL